jgi:plasmid stabilization system protein ParE
LGTGPREFEEEIRMAMIRTVRFKAAALKELYDAVSWYESHEVGLGARFEQEINSTLVRIKEAPEQFPIVRQHARKALASRFPYAIYFTIVEERIIVIAIYHGARDLSKLRSRIR